MWYRNWFLHNLISHPLSEVLSWFPRTEALSIWVHDVTVPDGHLEVQPAPEPPEHDFKVLAQEILDRKRKERQGRAPTSRGIYDAIYYESMDALDGLAVDAPPPEAGLHIIPAVVTYYLRADGAGDHKPLAEALMKHKKIGVEYMGTDLHANLSWHGNLVEIRRYDGLKVEITLGALADWLSQGATALDDDTWVLTPEG